MMKLGIEGLYLTIIKAVYGKPNLEQTLHKKVVGGEDPEFKSQYHKKKKCSWGILQFHFISFFQIWCTGLSEVYFTPLLRPFLYCLSKRNIKSAS
jgi:hypothetical protein